MQSVVRSAQTCCSRPTIGSTIWPVKRHVCRRAETFCADLVWRPARHWRWLRFPLWRLKVLRRGRAIRHAPISAMLCSRLVLSGECARARRRRGEGCASNAGPRQRPGTARCAALRRIAFAVRPANPAVRTPTAWTFSLTLPTVARAATRARRAKCAWAASACVRRARRRAVRSA